MASVRYRYDENRNIRYKTAEIIVEAAKTKANE